MSRNKKDHNKTPKSNVKAGKAVSAYQAEKNAKTDSLETVKIKKRTR